MNDPSAVPAIPPHRWVSGVRGPASPTLLLLHGTGGDEDDLLPLGRALSADASLLSPRGAVLENGMPRHFRRTAEGVFDEADLRLRAHDLAAFVRWSAEHHGFSPEQLYAVGFSNGANMAASLLLLEPGLLRGAVLWRVVMPFEPDQALPLTSTAVLMSLGRADALSPPARSERLAEYLRTAGARVTVKLQNAGHGLVEQDLIDARTWITGQLSRDEGGA